MIPLEVMALGFDVSSNQPVLIVGDDRKRLLLMMIGPGEATSIGFKLEKKKTPRPLTHDTFTALMEACGIEIDEVSIYDLRDGIFYAEIVARQGDEVKRIDSRPSDAVAIAVRNEAPIYITEKAAEKAPWLQQPLGEEDKKEFKDFLDQL